MSQALQLAHANQEAGQWDTKKVYIQENAFYGTR